MIVIMGPSLNGYQNAMLVIDKVTIQTKLIKSTQQKTIMSKHIRDIVEIQGRARQENHNGINITLPSRVLEA